MWYLPNQGFRRTRPKVLRSTMKRWLAPPRAKGNRRVDMNLRPLRRSGRRQGLGEHAAHQPPRHSGRNDCVHDPVDPARDDDGPADANLLASPLPSRSASIFRAREAGTRAFKMRFSRPWNDSGAVLEQTAEALRHAARRSSVSSAWSSDRGRTFRAPQCS